MKLLIVCLAMAIAVIANGQNLKWSAKCAPVQRETYGIAYSADGTKVLSGSECHPAFVKMWNSSNGSEVWSYTVPGSMVMCQMGVKFSSNGNFFASVEEMGWLLIFDNTGPTPVNTHTVNIKTNGSSSLDISPDNSKIVIDAADDTIKVVDIATGAIVNSIYANQGGVYAVAYSKDGSEIISGGNNGSLKLWDASNGTLIATLTGHAQRVSSTKFSDDNSRIVSSDISGNIRIWDATSQSLINSFSVTSSISQIDLSFDNKYLVAGADTSALLFDAVTGVQLSSFNNAFGGKVYSADFKPQSSSEVAIGNSNGDVSVFDLGDVVNGVDGPDESYSPFLLPNPTSGVFYVANVNDNTALEFILCNVSGEILKRGLLENCTFDITNLPSGIYYLKLFGSKAERQLTIVKQK